MRLPKQSEPIIRKVGTKKILLVLGKPAEVKLSQARTFQGTACTICLRQCEGAVDQESCLRACEETVCR